MMKKKGYSKGGMKKKGYAKGGMPMNPDTGKPTFVGDGVGKMSAGGSAVSKKISKLLKSDVDGGTLKSMVSKMLNDESGKNISDSDRARLKAIMKRKGGGSAMKKKGYSKGGAMKRKGGGSVLNKKGYAKGGAARIF